ncbi:MAG: hypothetical protein WBW04_21055 [Nitrolancea sp.]
MVAVLILVVLLTFSAGAAASATSDNASDRDCQGAFASEVAKTEQPVGTTVSDLASYSFGKLISGVASTCVEPE